MQTSLIGLEACSRAHFLGRALRKQGHDVRLIAAQFVKPIVKSNTNNFVDAEAIAEAVERKNMRFVPIKTDDQLMSRLAEMSDITKKPSRSNLRELIRFSCSCPQFCEDALTSSYGSANATYAAPCGPLGSREPLAAITTYCLPSIM